MMIFNSLSFFGLCSDFFLGYHNLGDLMAYFRNEVAGLFLSFLQILSPSLSLPLSSSLLPSLPPSFSLYAGNAPRYALPLSLSFLATYDPLLLNPLATYSNSKLYHLKST